MANDNLKDMGLGEAIYDAASPSIHSPEVMPSRFAKHNPFTQIVLDDPLWRWRKTDVLRLMNDYFKTIGTLYPAIDGVLMRDHACIVFDNLQKVKRHD